MAYGLRYQSDFYNTPPFNKLVSVKIYKKDYVGSVNQVRTSEVNIESNYEDDNTPIIGKGAKVVIQAKNEDMTYLEDLLLSYEKEFMCTIEYDGTLCFRGFTICDINERQLLPYAAVTVQFTDYLHRTDGKYPTLLQPIGGTVNLLSIVNAILYETGLDFPLLVNSTLFEDSMNKGANDCFLPQVVLQNSIFYSDSYTYDNIYDAVNKALKSFSAYLYSYNDKFIIERQEDITRPSSTDWILFDGDDLDSDYSGVPPSGVTTPSLMQSIDKQAGDFDYVEMSQNIEYNSGLHTLILRLMDKKLDTLIFNDWPAAESILKTPYYAPLADTLDFRNWYIHEDFANIEIGEDRRDIAQWIHYDTSATFVKGLCYQFVAYFNQGSDKDTILTIEYSQATNRDVSAIEWVGLYFILRLDGGPFSNYFLVVSGIITAADTHGLLGEPQINLIGPNSIFYRSDSCYNYEIFRQSEDNKENKWTLHKEIDLTNMSVRVYNNGTTFIQYNYGLQTLLGDPKWQKIIMTFCSPQYTVHTANIRIWQPQYLHLFEDIYLGDITVNINAEEIENKITYVLNKDFVKTEEVDLFLFDLENMNYANALLEVDGFTRTNLWTSENSPVPIPLYEVFAKCKFRKYGRTIHNLRALIKTDRILKPFCLINDSTIKDVDGEVIVFMLNEFTWDLINGQYDISAEEYTEEEVIVDGVTYDSEGIPEGQETPPPNAPAIWTISRGRMRSPIYITWTMVSGGIAGYILQRKPYYSPIQGIWIDAFAQCYQGNERTFSDDIARTGPMAIGTQVTYRVAAYNASGMSAWSSEASIIY